MVQKSSFRGVHSGNTLRASNSRYSRRYHNQACIISRVRTELLEKLAGETPASKVTGAVSRADDATLKLRQQQNIAVNVALSLNKQSRWLLPSALKRQIVCNNIDSSGLTVSLLERHKLKRQANCVSFHSNVGAVKRIQPRNSRYFSYNFPNADGVSRRARRRELMKEMREARKQKKNVIGSVIKVYTESGRAREERELGESEVRYEVFYPCPPSSSITHNPKYIKQDLHVAPGSSYHDDEHVQSGKSKKQHRRKQRKRVTLKDADDELDISSGFIPTAFSGPQSDFGGKVEVVPAKVDVEDTPISSTPTNAAPDFATTTLNESDNISTSTQPKDSDITPEQRTTQFLLSSLIDKAERAQMQCLAENFDRSTGKTQRRRRRSGGEGKQVCKHHEDDKSHIVYMPREENDDMDNEGDKQTPLPPLEPSSTPRAESSRVVLPADDVTVSSLDECFGQKYFEAGCKPRKFVLDVTESVREVMKKCGLQRSVADKTESALSFLVFAHDGVYDEDSHVYRVFLNTNLQRGLIPVHLVGRESSGDLLRGNVLGVVSQAMDNLSAVVTELQSANSLPAPSDIVLLKTSVSGRELKHHLAPSESYTPSVQRVFQQGSPVTSFVPPSLADMLEEDPSFCDVCYDDVSPLTLDSAHSTSLLKCSHRVCDACWEQHIHSRLHQGFVRLTCPGYDCQANVGVGVMLSVAPLDTVNKLLQRQEEVRVGASQTEKWCPGECGRVLRLHLPTNSAPSDGEVGESTASSDTELDAGKGDSSDAERELAEGELQQDVVCLCGAHVCFQCLQDAHWPASCAQAEEYRLNIATAVFPDREAEVHDDSHIMLLERERREMEKKKMMVVEGKHCPRCKSFVNKNGGCPNMTCRCGQIFCWFCAQPGYAHYSGDCADENQQKKITTTIIVNHIDSQKNKEIAEKEKKRMELLAKANRRQKVGLMEKAAEHRQHRQAKKCSYTHAITLVAKTVAAATCKDATLARNVLTTCSAPSSKADDTFEQGNASTVSFQLSASVMSTVAGFLRRAARSKQEVHEVAEYTLVLVKDLPDSLLRRRALRVAEDLTAFCTFTQSILDTWASAPSSAAASGAGVEGLRALRGWGQQEAVKAIVRLGEIQRWVNSALATHVTTIRKLRSSTTQ